MLIKLKDSRVNLVLPEGGTRSIHDGGVRRIFWVENLHARHFFGSRDLSRIFLGL